MEEKNEKKRVIEQRPVFDGLRENKHTPYLHHLHTSFSVSKLKCKPEKKRQPFLSTLKLPQK